MKKACNSNFRLQLFAIAFITFYMMLTSFALNSSSAMNSKAPFPDNRVEKKIDIDIDKDDVEETEDLGEVIEDLWGDKGEDNIVPPGSTSLVIPLLRW